MTSKIRLAVIGAGHLGRIHARLASRLPSFQLVAIADPLQEAAASLAEELGVEAHASHHTLLDRIDAAVIAAPTRHHGEIGVQLLNRGIHTLIEKPLAAHAAEASQLVACAEATKRVLQVGHVEQFNPVFNAVRQQIVEPKFIQARRFSGYSFRSVDIGVVLDVMIHDLDLILSLVDSPPVSFDGLGVSVMGQHEDAADVRITFANGCVAHLTASRVSYQQTREMQVWCPQAVVTMNFAEHSATVVRASESLREDLPDPESMTVQEKQRAKAELFEHYLPFEEIGVEPGNALLDELEDFADCIETGRSPRVTGSAGQKAVACCEAVLESIAGHAWDGRPDGRCGPFAALPPITIRPPHWHTEVPGDRRAG
ncbi:MAG: Gfo/Idh/MocA family oxidoreductase [Planctomycetales bacterium]|nr:Gfo/Idh/MocA family oxidoreductase [Planctomycetales bacterium]NIM09659.1 Gfo/Idh/MocA family oxidoreductase [Planctomycetales bacterium]NIN09142.1 Gfo/Idh/MocA family oxidoreductase [Planctomycetales bacterium]NIO35440.1 Gfo/Idh/MocA family oxidoreductase [Planctomycetales bacterium]NIO47185.1 Gfo/Idh/MocA family oxidoreductase [Planctomycetales bacterium]